MPELSAARRRAALVALALGGFGIGATEFVAMGLLPGIAHELLPGLWAQSQPQAIARAGLVIAAYAAGVVVGAPTIAATMARFPRKRLLLGFTAAFTLGTVLSAAAPTFALLVAARFVAALAHGAYFGVASLVAASIMGPGKRGRGVAFVLMGLSLANVVGIPLLTALGQAAGWRAAYVAVALVFAASVVAIALTLPPQPGDPSATLRRELGAFRSGQLWLTLALGSIGFGGFFAVDSYLAPLTTHVAGLPQGAVPIMLLAIGLGMTAGNLVGGRLADRAALRATWIVQLVMVAGLLLLGAAGLLGALAGDGVLLFALLLVLGVAVGGCSPAVQTRLLDIAHDSQTLGAALNHSALNLGNTLGATLGGAVIAAGLGYAAPAWVGVLLAAVGLGILAVSTALERRIR